MDANDEPIGISDEYINMNDDTDITTNTMNIVQCQKVHCRIFFRVTYTIMKAHINLYNNTGHRVQMCKTCIVEYNLKRGGVA